MASFFPERKKVSLSYLVVQYAHVLLQMELAANAVSDT